jgi:hypothetical protein
MESSFTLPFESCNWAGNLKVIDVGSISQVKDVFRGLMKNTCSDKR